MKKLVTAILCLAMLFLLVACGQSGEPAAPGTTSAPGANVNPGSTSAPGKDDAPSKTDTVVIAYATDPGNLSPFGTNNNMTDFVVYNIYEPLFRMNDADGSVKPVLMKDYELSVDGLTYTFHLNPGIVDTNGNAITASDVLFSFGLCNDSPMADNTSMVDFDASEAVDELTVKIVTTSSGPIYLSKIAKVYVVSEKSWNENPDGMVTNPVGTGPYKLADWVQGSSVKLVANEDYWGDKDFDVRNLEFKIISEASQRTASMMNGESNFIFDYLISDDNYINDTPGMTTDDRTSNTCYALYFDFSDGICQDENFRKAVCLALNNEGLTKMVYGTHCTPATTTEAKSCFDYSASWEGCEYYNYDVDKAKDYLAQSSYGGETLVLLTKSNFANFDLLSEAIQAQLKEIGVAIEIKQYEAATMRSMMLEQTDEWDLALNDHSSFSNYGSDSLNVGHVVRNYVHISGELQDTFKEYLAIANGSPDPEEAREYSSKAINLAQDACTIYGICYSTNKYAYTENLTNINTYTMGKIAWNEIIITG